MQWNELRDFVSRFKELRTRHLVWSAAFVFTWFICAQVFQAFFGKLLLDPWLDPLVAEVRAVAGSRVANIISWAANLTLALAVVGIPALLLSFVVHVYHKGLHATTYASPDQPDRPSRMDLVEAAKIAYGETRGTDFAVGAEIRLGKEGREHGIVTYYCYAIADRTPVYGYATPSTVPEAIDWRGRHLHFRFVKDELVLTDGHDGEIFTNLSVDAGAFSAALAAIKQIAPGRPEERRKLKVSEDLASWVKAARPILDALQDHDASPPTEEIGVWVSAVSEYLLSNLGLRYETRFTAPVRFSDEELGPLGQNPANVQRVSLERKIKLLHDIIDEHKI